MVYKPAHKTHVRNNFKTCLYVCIYIYIYIYIYCSFKVLKIKDSRLGDCQVNGEMLDEDASKNRPRSLRDRGLGSFRGLSEGPTGSDPR